MDVNSSNASLPIAVVGAGRMGENHARVYSRLKGVGPVYVTDIDPARAAAVAEKYGLIAIPSVEDLVGKAEAATIAVPSTQHAAVGGYLLDNGVHCLIEKPLATTEAACRELIGASERSGAILMVGHIERFNPAVRQLSLLLEEGHRVHAVETRRMSYASSLIQDINVVLDLMVHDLDIVLSLIREPIVEVTARKVSAFDTDPQGYVTALLTHRNGALANLTASRITQNNVRELNVTSDLGYINLDYRNQTLMIYREGHLAEPNDTSPYRGNVVLDLAMEKVLVRHSEPLMAELQHFVESARKGLKPLVTGEDALAALRIAWEIQRQVETDL